MNINDVKGIVDKRADELLSLSNVVAVGVGKKVTGGIRTDEWAVVCSVGHKAPKDSLSAMQAVPKHIDNVITDVVETHDISAQSGNVLRERRRPVIGGMSIGHPRVTVGTLGCAVWNCDGIYLLSNNHVLADSDAGEAGDAIYQPGRHDGGNDEDKIGVLHSWVPILDTEDNLVDAALCKPGDEEAVEAGVLGVGEAYGVIDAEPGMRVRKAGRTTGYTEGEIQQVHVTVDVYFGPGRRPRFTGQIMCGPMSEGGDSGSLVLAGDDAVSLLFAGSDRATLCNPIQTVLTALGVTIL